MSASSMHWNRRLEEDSSSFRPYSTVAKVGLCNISGLLGALGHEVYRVHSSDSLFGLTVRSRLARARLIYASLQLSGRGHPPTKFSLDLQSLDHNFESWLFLGFHSPFFTLVQISFSTCPAHSKSFSVR